MRAEVVRDEFGGYCCKRWATDDGFKNGVAQTEERLQSDIGPILDDNRTQGDICQILGIDIEKCAYELVRDEFDLPKDYQSYLDLIKQMKK